MTTLMVVLLVVVIGLQWTQMRLHRMWRAEMRGRLRAIDQHLVSVLQERLDVQAFIRARIAERATEFREGGGRERLRARMDARKAQS